MGVFAFQDNVNNNPIQIRQKKISQIISGVLKDKSCLMKIEWIPASSCKEKSNDDKVDGFWKINTIFVEEDKFEKVLEKLRCGRNARDACCASPASALVATLCRHRVNLQGKCKREASASPRPQSKYV